MLDCGNIDRIGNGAAGNSRWQIVQGGLFGYRVDLKAVILEFCDRKVENVRACCGIVERTLGFRENSMKRVMK